MNDRRYAIIYEDDWLMVVDKPSGLLTIPTPKKETNTLTDLLNRDLDERGIKANAYPCHRLDRETSGLIIYAKGKKVQRLIMDEFKNRTVKKTYTAFVQGAVKKKFDIIKSRIYNRNKNRYEEAVTRYRVSGRMKGFSILDIEPLTGRTNQIRIHLKELGHPLLGERVYAFRKDYSLRFRRVALHAQHIGFIHPITKKRLNFTSPMPQDMVNYIHNKPEV